MAAFGDASAEESKVTGDGIEKSGDAVKSAEIAERTAERAAEASRPKVEAMAPRDGEPEAVAPHTPRTQARSGALRERMAAYQQRAENAESTHDTKPTDVPALPRDMLRSRMAAFSGRCHEPAAAGPTAVAAAAGSEEDAATGDAAGETSPGKEGARPVASRPASLKNKIDAYLSPPKAEKTPVPAKPADMPDPAVGDAGEGPSDKAADTGTGPADGAGSVAEQLVHEAVPAPETDARHETDALRVVESVREDDDGQQSHAPRISSDALRERMAAYQHKAENIEFRRDTKPTDVPVLPKNMLRRRMAAFSGQRSGNDDGATAEEEIVLSPTGRTTISEEIPKDNTAKNDLVVDVAPAPEVKDTAGESSPMSPKDFARPADVPRSFLKDKMTAYLSSPNREKAPVKPDDMSDLPSNLLKSRMNAFGGGHEADGADEKTESADEGASPRPFRRSPETSPPADPTRARTAPRWSASRVLPAHRSTPPTCPGSSP
ncbi:hypothetical protein THAOC_24009 [Thalassiosira oceanica]|uniref:Uncharacterized protein n=1 Tax=Thalassiosira oceanica TaxID=159749 RepID=K0RUS0_THAOC|nr:hypothetical protein THAOC_24009 [Thalassiosira oceanica]|eukprot:EJK56159.1 hypothetical protein THAOC_24009 [Thalassiosira oceanica]